MPHVGLEPTHRKALDPKSSASTNSASGAIKLVYLRVTETVNIFFLLNFYQKFDVERYFFNILTLKKNKKFALFYYFYYNKNSRTTLLVKKPA